MEIMKEMLKEENETAANIIVTQVMINSINNLINMIPHNNIRHNLESTLTECEDILEQEIEELEETLGDVDND